MDEESVARGVVSRARKPGEASPVPTVDDRYARLLAEDLGVKETTARTAFIGEPQIRALGVVAWAFKHAPDSPKKRAQMILLWAKKRRAGAFREQGDAGDGSLAGVLEREGARFERLAEALARLWVAHPESLAEAIRALEADRNGQGS